MRSHPLTHSTRPQGVCRRGTPSQNGFSLVELLTVLAVATLLASLSFPAFSGIQSAKLGDSITILSDYLKQAQTMARASNSYVWIGFAQNPTDLEVVALQGTSGVSSDLTSGLVRPAAKALHLQGVVLDPAGKLPVQPQSPSPSTISLIGASGLGSSGSFTYPVAGSAQTFSNVIGITPRGEAYLSDPNTFVHWIQIGVAAYPYNSTSGQMPNGKAPVNFGELFLAGLTGEINVERP